MSTYREIVGKKIKKVSSDPSSGTEGEMWYNSATGTLRGPAITEAWASASPLLTAVYYNCGAGDQTAALSFQGTAGPNPSTSTQTEEYNGSGWATGGATPVAKRSGMGAGTQTAALSAGGATAPGTASTSVDEYNGTAWTSANALSVGRRYTAGCGTQTAAICTGGQNPGGTQIDSTEEYDGTNWTSGGAWPKTIRQEVLLGTQTATLGAGGYSTVTEVEAYEYNGSSWTATGDMNQQRYVFQGFGTQTQGIVCGGEPAPAAATKTESYDGSTFSNSPATLGNPTAQAASGVASPGTAGIIFGDAAGGTAANTEEYNKSTNVITAAAWASIPTYPTPNSYSAGFGTTTASVVAGGDGPPGNGITTTGEYDGSSWTTGGALNTGRRGLGAATNGSETAGLVFGGSNPGVPTQYANVEEYNGSAWSEETNLPGTLNNLGGFGTQTAGAALPPSSATTLEYDGSSWASGGNLTTTRDKTMGGGAGLQTAGLCIAGGPVPGVSGGIEEYNGTAWTATVPSTYINDNNASNGIQTAALSMGASNPPSLAAGIQYDGTTARTVANMGTGRYAATASGSAGNSSALAITGRTPPRSNACEEYTEETSSANIKDFTTS